MSWPRLQDEASEQSSGAKASGTDFGTKLQDQGKCSRRRTKLQKRASGQRPRGKGFKTKGFIAKLQDKALKMMLQDTASEHHSKTKLDDKTSGQRMLNKAQDKASVQDLRTRLQLAKASGQDHRPTLQDNSSAKLPERASGQSFRTKL